MTIKVLGTESLGVRGLSCFVKTKDRAILIDPGIALGYFRYKLLPHPFQVAVGERIRREVIKKWSMATDIIISHFHGDHTPLMDANPYQLNIKKLIGLNKTAKIFIKDFSCLTPLERDRTRAFSSVLGMNLIHAEGTKKGPITFSKAMLHGEKNNVTVMMTKIQEGNDVFVHTSDIQLLDNRAILQILTWRPNIVLASGPPLYLFQITKRQREEAWYNSVQLAKNVGTLILDHHLLRCDEGIFWLRHLAAKTKKRVMCAADFMKKPRMFLEAYRPQLYKIMPVDKEWHQNYIEGKIRTDFYWNLAKKFHFDRLFH